MMCRCGDYELKTVYVFDNAQDAEPEHAYNLWACDGCGLVMKEDVWSNAGKRWLSLDGTLELEEP